MSSSLIVIHNPRHGSLASLKTETGGFASSVYLEGRERAGDGGEGLFIWENNDQREKITADPEAGVYVPPNSDPTGASGCWVRAEASRGEYRPQWFATTHAVTDDATAAIQAAINLVCATGGGVVYFPRGTYVIAAALHVTTGSVTLRGAGSTASIIEQRTAGAGGITNASGKRIYGLSMQGVCFRPAARVKGGIGVDLDSVSSSRFVDVVVLGFDVGFRLHSGTAGGCVYNRFADCLASACHTGYQIASASSNANTFVGCRANICASRGWDIQDSNDNTCVGCQAEAGGVGFYLNAAVAGTSDVNRFIGCRAENNAVGFQIAGANVRDTVILFPWLGNTTNITDAGSRTQIVEPKSSYVSMVSTQQDRPFRFTRLATGGSEVPAMVVRDSVSSAGTPVTLQIETERGEGYFLRGVRGGTTYFTISTTGDIVAAGGFRQILAGWSQAATVARTQADAALADALSPRGRIMPRAGSITGVAVNLSSARTAGTLTIKVQKSTDGGTTWVTINGLEVSISSACNKAQAIFAKDTHAFAAGDMLRAAITTAGFSPTANSCDVAIEVEL